MGKYMKNKYHGGETARKYRREVVALAKKPKESVLNVS